VKETLSIITIGITQFAFLFKCVLSLVLGSSIGIEREYKNKPAGFKTHVLITLGATILTHLSINLSGYGDPGRIAAQIVSGIGFIGAGTIMQSKQVIQGLTTAATLWVAAAIGMLVGAEMYLESTVVTIIITLFLLATQLFSKTRQDKQSYSVSIEVKKHYAIEKIEQLIERFDISITNKMMVKSDTIHIDINYHATPLSHHLFLRRILSLKGIGDVIKL